MNPELNQTICKGIITIAALGLLQGLGCFAPSSPAAEITDLGETRFSGKIVEDRDLSGAAVHGESLLIASDEGCLVQVLEPTSAQTYSVKSEIQLLAKPKDEVDIEAIAIQGDQVYVAGSHAIVRKKVEYPDDSDDRTYAKNRKRLAETELEATRQHIFRFTLAANGSNSSAIETLALRPLLANDPYLAGFLDVPAKEGGIDIEGMAIDGDQLVIGFRGPILRQNYVPVLRLRFDQAENYEVLFVNLEGYGIRDMLKVSGGFLIIAGPLGDGSGAEHLYFWDGRDCVPGTDVTPSKLVKLGKIPAPPGGKAEAIALLSETPTAWTLLTLYDGAANGAPRKLSVVRP